MTTTTRADTAQTRNRSAGFSLVELLVAIAIGAIVMTIGIPILQGTIERAKLEGQIRSLAVLAAQARATAITNNVETVLQFDGTEFVTFADRDGTTLGDPPDGVFNPVTGAEYKTTDWEVGRQPLADSLDLGGPSGEAAIDGFDYSGVSEVRPNGRAIFNPDGSLIVTGAFRIRDRRGNFLELSLEPRATGKATVRKWNGSDWREQGEGDVSWDWK